GSGMSDFGLWARGLAHLAAWNRMKIAGGRLDLGVGMEFAILGPTELRIDGRLIPLGAAKQRGLLATLLYHAGDLVQVATIVELLWPGRDPDTCRTLLYTLASRLRATLRTAGIPEALTRMPGVSAYRLDI